MLGEMQSNMTLQSFHEMIIITMREAVTDITPRNNIEMLVDKAF